ncbi:MAG: EamA family transporter [Cyanobacteria bacterium P01_A01_bin.114]
MQQNRSQQWAVAALVLLATIWGYNWILMKIAVRYAPAFDFAAMRAFYGSLSLFLMMIWRGQSLKPRALAGTAGYGILQSGGTIGLATWALVHGGAGKTAILTYTMSFWTLLFAWAFLNERLKKQQWLSIGLALVGIALILLPFSLASDLLSKGLAVFAGVSWALASIVAKRLHRDPGVDLLSLTAWQMLLGSLPLMAISLLTPSAPIQWTPTFVGILIYNAVPGSAIAWLLWLYALKHLSTHMVSLGALLTPVLGVGMAAVQLGEIPTPTELAGIGLILLALMLSVSFKPSSLYGPK